jgi:hypothetical protein
MGPALAVNHRAGAKRAVGFRFMHQDGLEVFRPCASLAGRACSASCSVAIMIDIDNAEALHVVHVAGLSFGDLIASALALKKSAAIMAMIFSFIYYAPD